MRKLILNICLLLFPLFLPSNTNSLPSTTHVLIYPPILPQSATNTTSWLTSPTTSSISNLSFCLWIKLYFLSANRILHYPLNDNQGFRFTLQEKYGFLKLKNVDYLFDYIHPLEPDVWNHFCLVYNGTSHEAKIYMNGEVTFEVIDTDNLGNETFRDDLMSKISIGQQKESYSQPLKGEVTLLNIWSSVLPSPDIYRGSQCKLSSTPPDLVDWETAGWDRGSSILETRVDRLPLCEGKVEGTVIGVSGGRVKMAMAVAQCKGLGGVMEAPANQEELLTVYTKFDQLDEKCNNKFWIPMRQINEKWVDTESSDDVHYLPWLRGQPNGLTHQACAEVSFKSFKDDGMFGYNDLNCAVSTRCYYCKMPPRNKFRVRGLCEKSSMDSAYKLNIDDPDKDRPFWKGYRKTQIIFDDTTKAWRIEKFDTKAIIAVYNTSTNFPVGLRKWTIINDKCEDAEWQKTLMLSSCSDDEFSCGDGSCVPISKKCNGVMDCKDDLDEYNCHFVEFPETRRYQNNLPSIRLYEGILQPLQVRISIDVLEVSGIDEKGMKFGSKYVVGLTWFEDRLRWRDLSENTNLNLLSQEEENKLWLPRVIFSNAKYGPEVAEADAISVNIHKMTPYSRSRLDRLEEVALYEGKENEIIFKQEFEKAFSCNFQLHRYPFDTQRCTIQIRMPGEVKELVKLIPEEVVYLGPKVLMQYNVMGVSMANVTSGIQVQLVLQRSLKHHIANTYLPTFCLWWICQSCLYFKSEHFKTTSGVSITVMLVMYTLYQSVSVKLPPTSYLKLVDVWLIFGLVLPFMTFFILITVEHTPVGRTKTALSNFGKFILPVLILLFAVTYFIVACVLYNTA